MNTPWGESQIVEKVADGIFAVATAGHGGYRLDKARNAKVPEAWREASFNGNGRFGWYEEDCDWAMVALTFPEVFPPQAQQAAREMMEWIHPELKID